MSTTVRRPERREGVARINYAHFAGEDQESDKEDGIEWTEEECILCHKILQTPEAKITDNLDDQGETTFESVLSNTLQISEWHGHQSLCSSCVGELKEVFQLEQQLDERRRKIRNLYRESIRIISSAQCLSALVKVTVTTSDKDEVDLEDTTFYSDRREEGHFNDVILSELDELLEQSESNEERQIRTTVKIAEELLPKLKMDSAGKVGLTEEMIKSVNAKISMAEEENVTYVHFEAFTDMIGPGITCSICNKQFENLDSALEHVSSRMVKSGEEKEKSEINERPKKKDKFQCDICDRKFTRKASLLEHSNRHKGKKDKTCPICGKRFYSSSYWRHLATVHAKEEKLIYECPVCHRRFSHRFKLKQHELCHLPYEKRAFECEACQGKRFATPARLRSHIMTVHKEEEDNKQESDNLCKDCGMTFNTTNRWKNHRKKFHESNKENRKTTLNCVQCSMTFSSISLLEKHLRAHEMNTETSQASQISELPDTAQLSETLQIPSEPFEGSDRPPDIILNDENIILEEGITSDTGSIMKTKTLLSNEPGPSDEQKIWVRLDDANLILPLVNEDSAQKDPQSQTNNAGIVFEIEKGDDEKKTRKSICDICGKKFKSEKYKKSHIKMIHGQGEPFKCTICEKVFARSQYLKEHVKLHNQEKNIPCSFCDKKFRSDKELTRHMRVHTGEKPYKCDDCGKTFSHTSNLSEHRTIHTGRLNFTCNKCQKKFRLWSSLNKHSKKCKNEIKSPNILPQIQQNPTISQEFFEQPQLEQVPGGDAGQVTQVLLLGDGSGHLGDLIDDVGSALIHI